jgi:hypothetical protein
MNNAYDDVNTNNPNNVPTINTYQNYRKYKLTLKKTKNKLLKIINSRKQTEIEIKFNLSSENFRISITLPQYLSPFLHTYNEIAKNFNKHWLNEYLSILKDKENTFINIIKELTKPNQIPFDLQTNNINTHTETQWLNIWKSLISKNENTLQPNITILSNNNITLTPAKYAHFVKHSLVNKTSPPFTLIKINKIKHDKNNYIQNKLAESLDTFWTQFNEKLILDTNNLNNTKHLEKTKLHNDTGQKTNFKDHFFHKLTDFVYYIGPTINYYIPEFVLQSLDQGIDFVPIKAKYPMETLDKDFSNFERRLLWNYFFSNNKKATTTTTENTFLPIKLTKNIQKRNYAPNNTRIKNWTNNTKNSFTTLINTSSHNEESNNNAHFYKTINFFKTNTQLVVKSADKGSGTVIMHNSFYKKIGDSFLTDNNQFFKELKSDPTPTILNIIIETLKNLLQAKDINKYLHSIIKPPANIKTPNLYFLPKIHKYPNISGRPIVSANGHPAEQISIFIDYILQPYSTMHPLFLKDTTSLLAEIHNVYNIPDNAILFSIDVVNMYTNIPLDEMINTIIDTVKQNPQHLVHKKFNVNPKTLKKLLELVFYTNYFTFAQKIFLQTHGIAMGTACACAASDIYICNFVSKYFFNWRLKPKFYKQYRDDSFGIWTYGEESLIDYLDYLNQIHPNIKFTIHYGRTIEYLDLKITLTPFGTISTETYYKPTDTFQYLHYSSNHPKHTLDNIPKSQTIRHLRNCSNRASFYYHSTILFFNLLKRNFPHKTIRLKIQSIFNIKRCQYLKYKTKNQYKRTPLIITYNKNLPNLSGLIHQTFPKDLNNINTPLVGYRIFRSLGQSIIRAKFTGH